MTLFIREIQRSKPNEALDEAIVDQELRKCQQWWKDRKIWKLLADTVNPAILLLIPSGHKVEEDGGRYWDSEYGTPSNIAS